MTVITYPQLNGQVAIVVPAGDVEHSIKDVPSGVPYKIIEYPEIDDAYFDAYEFDKEVGAKVNIGKAKFIHLDKFRAARVLKLAALDVAFMRAVEQADVTKQTEIAAQKQALRDVTKIELPNTLLEIKAIWPDILN
jgi:hypothetical protein